MDIKEKMHTVEIISKDRPVRDIAPTVEDEVPDAFLVMEKGKIIGILTDTDILIKVRHDELDSKDIKVKDIMTTPVITIDSSKTAEEAVKLMEENEIKKLPVIENGMPIGVIYGEDFLDFDEEGWKGIIFKQTVQEVYKLIVREPDMDCADVLNIVREIDKFKDMNSRAELDMFIYQEGIVHVAYHYIKENSGMSLLDIIENIRKDYDKLLEKYQNAEDKCSCEENEAEESESEEDEEQVDENDSEYKDEKEFFGDK